MSTAGVIGRLVRRLALAGLLLIGVLIPGFLILCEVQNSRGEAYARGLEADLQRQVPPGSSREAAATWFASHGVNPKPIARVSDGRECGLYASIPDDRFPDAATIDIWVDFDEHGRVTTVGVRRVIIGL